jgi:hypothetical protein
LHAERPEIDRERRDFDRDRRILVFGDTFGTGDSAETGDPLEICRARDTGEAGGGVDALETGDTLGIGSILEVRGEADFDFGDGGFDDPIGAANPPKTLSYNITTPNTNVLNSPLETKFGSSLLIFVLSAPPRSSTGNSLVPMLSNNRLDSKLNA